MSAADLIPATLVRPALIRTLRAVRMCLLSGFAVSVVSGISGCREPSLLKPRPLLEEKLSTVPLVLPGTPLASHQLDFGYSAQPTAPDMAWKQWLLQLNEPPLVSCTPGPRLSAELQQALSDQAAPWLNWLKTQANKDDATAQTVLGMVMTDGTLIKSQSLAGHAWLEKAAAKGGSGAGYPAWELVRQTLGCGSGEGPQPRSPYSSQIVAQYQSSPVELDKWLTLAASQNVGHALEINARLLRDGKGLVQNLPAAQKQFQILAQNKDLALDVRINALTNAGLMEWFGQGGAVNQNKARSQWKSAVELASGGSNNNHKEQADAGLPAYLLGLSLTRQPEQQKPLFIQAGMKQVPGALNQLGLLLWDEQEYTTSATYFEKGQAHGDSFATYNLGLCYYTGKGRTPSAHRAMVALMNGVLAGDRNALRLAGFLYWQGPESVPVNVTKARYYFTRAAEQGDLYSHYALGVIYGVGQGVSRDLASAWSHLALAAAWGLPEAASLRDMVAQPMDELQKEWARHQAQTLFDSCRRGHCYLSIDRQPTAITRMLNAAKKGEVKPASSTQG